MRLDDVALFPIVELVRPVAPRRELRAMLRAARGDPRRSAPQVVHTHSSKAGVLGRLAAHLERVPVVIHSIHGFGFTPLQPPPVRALFLASSAGWRAGPTTSSRCHSATSSSVSRSGCFGGAGAR